MISYRRLFDQSRDFASRFSLDFKFDVNNAFLLISWTNHGDSRSLALDWLIHLFGNKILEIFNRDLIDGIWQVKIHIGLHAFLHNISIDRLSVSFLE